MLCIDVAALENFWSHVEMFRMKEARTRELRARSAIGEFQQQNLFLWSELELADPVIVRVV